MEADLPDWSALDHELLGKIAVRTALIEDFMAFRGVCSSWRGAASKNRFKPSSPRVPLLMLSQKEDSDDREFYSPSKKKICMRLSLPQLKGRKCVEARFGWLLTLASSGEVSLFNPLSGAQIEVPNYRSFPYSEAVDLKIDPAVGMYDFTRRAVLSANPSDTSNFVLMVLLDASRGLGIWRAGGKSWMAFKGFQEVDDIACYNDKFYGVRNKDFDDIEVWVWDPFGSDLLTNIILRTGLPPYRVNRWMDLVLYLEESSDGKLVLITSHELCDGFWQFGVTMLDVLKCQRKTITGNLEDEVVFLGRNASVSVAASSFFNVLKPNRIYFTHEGLNLCLPFGRVGSIAIGIFHFELEHFDSLGSIEDEDFGSLYGYTYISGPDLLWIASSS